MAHKPPERAHHSHADPERQLDRVPDDRKLSESVPEPVADLLASRPVRSIDGDDLVFARADGGPLDLDADDVDAVEIVGATARPSTNDSSAADSQPDFRTPPPCSELHEPQGHLIGSTFRDAGALLARREFGGSAGLRRVSAPGGRNGVGARHRPAPERAVDGPVRVGGGLRQR